MFWSMPDANPTSMHDHSTFKIKLWSIKGIEFSFCLLLFSTFNAVFKLQIIIFHCHVLTIIFN